MPSDLIKRDRKPKPAAKAKVKPKHRKPTGAAAHKAPRKQNGQGAPVGNEFYKFVQNPGREKEYTPAALWDKAMEYFQWVNDNPLIRVEVGRSGKDFGKQINVPVKRPYTLGGLCLFLNISRPTFTNYSEGIGYKEYFSICAAIKDIIHNQKFEGAASGFFNPAIIARDLGLVDKRETDVGNKNNQPFQTENKTLTAEITPDMDEKQASQLYRALLNPPKQEA